MTEISIRRMPSDGSRSHRAIIQVPLSGTEQVYQLADYLFSQVSRLKIDWVTPVQISQQYMGVPSPGFTFIVRPSSEQEKYQIVDVFYNLHLVQSFTFNGIQDRLVSAGPYEQVGDGIQDLSVLSSTIAFLVQYTEYQDEDTENPIID